MEIISIVSQKGGCGKTTLAVNLAAALSRLGNEVLLIDLDPQAHATFALGYTEKAQDRKTTYDIFKTHIEGGEINFDELIISGDRANLSFIPSTMLLSATEINLGNVNGAAAILSRNLYDPYFEKYKYVIIDSPPSFGFLTLNALYASSMILVPIDLSYFSFNGVNNIYKITGLLDKETGKSPSIFFLLNIYDKRSNFAKKLEHEAKKKLGQYLFSTKVRASVRLREAAQLGKTIFEHDPRSQSALDFYNLVSEVIAADKVKIDTMLKEFLVSAPKAGEVYVVGDFNGWKKTDSNRLAKLEDGSWTGHLTLKRGRYRYKYIIDDQWVEDPDNPNNEKNSYGSVDSILIV